jgi:polyphosphate kinase 2 (PPK2 family)
MLVRSGIILLKYWFSITDAEQNLRFLMRLHDPLKQWKRKRAGGWSRATTSAGRG